MSIAYLSSQVGKLSLSLVPLTDLRSLTHKHTVPRKENHLETSRISEIQLQSPPTHPRSMTSQLQCPPRGQEVLFWWVRNR
jgi:hypothetical protein